MNLVGITPYFHQKAVIDELREAKGTGKIVVCNSSRQKGKSYMVTFIVTSTICNYNNTKPIKIPPLYVSSWIFYLW